MTHERAGVDGHGHAEVIRVDTAVALSATWRGAVVVVLLLLLIHTVLLGIVGEPVHRVEEVIFRFVLDERAGCARVGHGVGGYMALAAGVCAARREMVCG